MKREKKKERSIYTAGFIRHGRPEFGGVSRNRRGHIIVLRFFLAPHCRAHNRSRNGGTGT
jgi:hypothetical protein